MAPTTLLAYVTFLVVGYGACDVPRLFRIMYFICGAAATYSFVNDAALPVHRTRVSK